VPDLAILALGALVTVIAVIACLAVGRGEDQDARDRGEEP
jgi:hypothetical protein